MKKVIFIFSLLLLMACSSEDEFQLHILTIDEAVTPTSLNAGDVDFITVKYTLPNPCYHFYNLYYEYEGTSRIVAIRALEDLSTTCSQVTVQEEYTFPVQVLQTEDYTFKFWKGKDSNGEDIFEEVVVPVN